MPSVPLATIQPPRPRQVEYWDLIWPRVLVGADVLTDEDPVAGVRMSDEVGRTLSHHRPI